MGTWDSRIGSGRLVTEYDTATRLQAIKHAFRQSTSRVTRGVYRNERCGILP